MNELNPRPMTSSNENLIVLEGIKKYYPVKRGLFSKTVVLGKAVDGVDLMIRTGETMGLVGESGCGKSTLSRVILRLENPTEGTISFEGENILDFGKGKLQNLRQRMQIVFQDPYSSLDPRKTVGHLIGEPLVIHGIGRKSERKQIVLNLLAEVGLRPEHIDRYPHQFSGGQRQRIGIARALCLRPKFIICDEPVSALDVSVQAQVINLLKDLQVKYQLTYLFISHDLSVVEHISDRVAVMYLGQIVECADRDSLFRQPLHPYTKALLSASPSPIPNKAKMRIILKGDVPSVFNPPSGCGFHSRCPIARSKCRDEKPRLMDVGGERRVRCPYY
ncbi:MAG: dipeptide ABC transporter ATP-binding protein [Thermodesulfobacteriota bacterium]